MTSSKSILLCLGRLAVLTLVLSVCGCNGVFYFPDPVIYMTPEKVELTFVEHWITTADGVKLNAWHIKPKAAVHRPGIVVLHMHGNAENMSTHFLYVAWLAEMGFDVVTFDYRGYGKSSGQPNQTGLVQDGLAMVKFTRELLKDEPLIVFGQSLGGAVAVPVVALSPPGEVAAIAVESTFDSYRGVARAKLGEFWLTWLFQVPLSLLVSDDFGPEDYAPKLRQPFVVIHSQGDPVVPIESGRRLYAKAAHAPKEFWELASAEHTGAFLDPEDPIRPRFLTFLCKAAKRPCPHWKEGTLAP